MKFDCGMSSKEFAERIEDGTHPRLQWREWYAWYPVELGSHDCRWFETVMKREHRWNSWSESGWTVEYATIEDYNNIPANEFNKRYED